MTPQALGTQARQNRLLAAAEWLAEQHPDDGSGECNHDFAYLYGDDDVSFFRCRKCALISE